MSGLSRIRTTGVLATAALVAVSLTGCGGQWLWEIEEQKNVDLSQVQYLPVPAEEQAKDVLEAIEADPEINAMVPDEYRGRAVKWTTSVGYPPMEMYASNGKDIIGVDAAISQAVMRRMGLEMTIEDQEFNSQIPGIMSGRYDVVISSMTDNEERRKTTTFVDYVQAGNAFLVAKGNPLGIKDPMDLCGKTLAVVDAGSSAELADEFSAKCTDAGKPAYDILRFDGDQNANLALKSGRANATITDYPVAQWHASKPENEMTSVRISGGESIWGIGVGNDDPKLAEAMQAALQSLIDDGTYAEILAAWNVEDMAIDEATINGGE